MDDLKNLVIQSLETNGVLGQVRAQLRHCVFKAIDNQDQVEQRKSSFHWENPLARKLRENSQATLAAEVIAEFMEFYRLNYSLAIFGPEANIKGKTENRGDLAKKVGVTAPTEKPILVAIMEALASGAGLAPSSSQAAAPAEAPKEQPISTSL
jgi:FGFR1 oncogene partner